MVICQNDECNKRAYFGLIDDGIPLFCKTHKLSNYVNVKNKKCIHEGCTIQPSYGLIDDKIPLFCKAHKSKEHIDVKNKKCIQDGCNKQPAFGLIGDKIPIYCTNHKLEGYVDVVSKTCIYEDCDKRPTYGIKGSVVATHCAEHKLENYVDVKHKLCIHKDCITRPNYGIKGSVVATHCAKHKLEDYVDVINKTCIHPNCDKQPAFGLIDDKIPIYCTNHKLEGYVDVVSKTCSHADCDKRPTYGIKGTGVATHCAKHKLKNYVDVKHKLCIHEDCTTRSSFGFTELTHCATHKTKGMLFRPNAKCKKCKNKALYGDPVKLQPLFCEDHKEPTSFNLMEKPCTKCNLPNVLNSEKLCMICSEFEVSKTRVKKYELEMKTFLDANEFKYESYDKPIDKNCSLKRPDFVMRVKYQTIILEVDEFQHSRKSYTPECEDIRMKEIYMANGEGFMTFIRFNPNNYYNKSNKLVKTTAKRYDYLLKFLNEKFEEKMTCNLKAVYLYYDGFDETNPLSIEHDPYK